MSERRRGGFARYEAYAMLLVVGYIHETISLLFRNCTIHPSAIVIVLTFLYDYPKFKTGGCVTHPLSTVYKTPFPPLSSKLLPFFLHHHNRHSTIL